ncbi:copper resistance CopC/CopD family protein [Actinokineospora globicatena]|uniref:copper resistance CopC/CopD family protein n=1 Tax=Actinokineospora globicatena TaxID=103729 RepID=UPI0020A567F0|nr:copper resistance protein CopC [Actinokineospora globicatena]MCP2303617.1 copper transport protein [Actinokineospora globicatena]GLW79246.1 copper resistance protein [Actinokineospora globicatena]GLW86344.1 copper resistance protein [Actinokineospora globicatena]
MRLAGLLAVLFCWAVLAAPPASAHVEVLGSTPADGARLTEVPTEVRIQLSENVGVQKDALRVVDVHGEPVSEGRVTQGATAEELTIKLKPGLPDGTYLVHYAFVSADSHPVRGGFAFVVGDGPLMNAGGAVSDADGTDTGVDVLTRVVRWVGYTGVALAGGLVFLLYCRNTRDQVGRKVVQAGCVIVAGAGILALGVEGAYVTGAGLSRVFAPDLLANTLETAYGKLLVLRVIAAVVLLLAARRLLTSERETSAAANTAIIAGFVVLLSSAAAGHAITTKVMFLSLIADLAHYGSMALWLGGVVQLALLANHDDLAAALTRFSPIAKVSVAVIVLSGVLMSAAYLGSVSAVWSSTYGVLLLGKTVGFVVLLALADRCRVAARQGIAGGTTLVGVRTTTLRRVLVTEVTIAAAVLAIAAVVATTGTPG